MRTTLALILFILVLGADEWLSPLSVAHAETGGCDATVGFPVDQKEIRLSEKELPFVICWEGWVCSDRELSSILEKIKKQIASVHANGSGLYVAANSEIVGLDKKAGQTFAAINALRRVAKKISRSGELKQPKIVISQLKQESLKKEFDACYARKEKNILSQWSSWYLKIEPIWNKGIGDRVDTLRKIAIRASRLRDACVGRYEYGYLHRGLMDELNEMKDRRLSLQERARELRRERDNVMSELGSVREWVRNIGYAMQKKEELEKILDSTKSKIRKWEEVVRKQKDGTKVDAEQRLRDLRSKLTRYVSAMKYYKKKSEELEGYKNEEDRLVGRNEKIIREMSNIAEELHLIRKKLEPLESKVRQVCQDWNDARDELYRKIDDYNSYIGQFVDLLNKNLPRLAPDPHKLVVTVIRKGQEISSLAGSVRSQDGKPLAEADVSVKVGGKQYVARSGKDGHYRIALPEGVGLPDVVTVLASKDGYKPGSVKVSKIFGKHGDIVLARQKSAVDDQLLSHTPSGNTGPTWVAVKHANFSGCWDTYSKFGSTEDHRVATILQEGNSITIETDNRVYQGRVDGASVHAESRVKSIDEMVNDSWWNENGERMEAPSRAILGQAVQLLGHMPVYAYDLTASDRDHMSGTFTALHIEWEGVEKKKVTAASQKRYPERMVRRKGMIRSLRITGPNGETISSVALGDQVRIEAKIELVCKVGLRSATVRLYPGHEKSLGMDVTLTETAPGSGLLLSKPIMIHPGWSGDAVRAVVPGGIRGAKVALVATKGN